MKDWGDAIKYAGKAVESNPVSRAAFYLHAEAYENGKALADYNREV